jgi:hypothetical protein
MKKNNQLPDYLRDTVPDLNGNCRRCAFRRNVDDPIPGVKIPGRTGFGSKCIKPDGICDAYDEKY